MRFRTFLLTSMATILLGCGSSVEQETDQSSILPDGPTCDDITCDPGETCVLEGVVCFRAPCPPVPICVPEEPPSCDDVSCPGGEHCELQEVWCIRAPCPPIPVCVPDPDFPTCDDLVCPAGQHCELEGVVCFTEPCPPWPICVDD